MRFFVKYRACCCTNVLTFTVIAAVVELVVLVVMLFADVISPQIVCVNFHPANDTPAKDVMLVERSNTVVLDQEGGTSNIPTHPTVDEISTPINDSHTSNLSHEHTWTEMACVAKPAGQTWSLMQILMAVLLLVGVRFRKWYLLLPHLIWQGVFLVVLAVSCLILIVVAILLASFVEDFWVSFGCFAFGIACGLLFAVYFYVFMCIIRACQYLYEEKRRLGRGCLCIVADECDCGCGASDSDQTELTTKMTPCRTEPSYVVVTNGDAKKTAALLDDDDDDAYSAISAKEHQGHIS